MEIVVLVLMFLVMFMTWLKLSFLKAWHIAVISAICSLFIVLTWRIAIEESCSTARRLADALFLPIARSDSFRGYLYYPYYFMR